MPSQKRYRQPGFFLKSSISLHTSAFFFFFFLYFLIEIKKAENHLVLDAWQGVALPRAASFGFSSRKRQLSRARTSGPKKKKNRLCLEMKCGQLPEEGRAGGGRKKKGDNKRCHLLCSSPFLGQQDCVLRRAVMSL